MSLQARLLAGMALIALVLAGAAVLVARTTEDDLVARIDAQLEAANAGGRFGGPGGPRRPGGDPDGAISSFYVAVRRAEGDLAVLATPNATGDGVALPRLDDAPLAAVAADARPRAFTAPTDGDLRYRALARRGRGGQVVVLALPLGDVDAAVARLVRLLVVATALVFSALALVTWWVVRLGVRPLRSMTATAATIAGGDLSRRVPAAEPGTEAGELGAALNAMLGRIEGAFDERARSEVRLRRFVADASHELRTPVTTIRGYAELYRVGGLSDPDELRSAMGRTEAEAIRMGCLIEDLLLLARLDQGRPLEREPVDLAVLADDAARDARAVDPARTVTAAAEAGAVVLGDDARLRQVVANLLANALVHTPPGTPVEVWAGRSDGRAVLEVVDHGPGMAPEVAERAFERFYRADPSRSRHRGGSGLGLAIVQATVEAHGGAVTLRTAPGAGTAVRVELPALPATSAEALSHL